MSALGANPVIVIAGPTASGKSSLALELAEHLWASGKPAEILCADSITVFRGFEIGAAKPSLADRKRIPHHLIDLADPCEEFTAGDFVREARKCIADCHERQVIPLVVGGTGFYLRALLWEMAAEDPALEARSAEVKMRLEARAAAEGMDVLYKELLARDPQSAKTVHGNDHYRVVRALQAMELYGRPWSELNKEARESPPRYPEFRYFCLSVEKSVLEERIRKRAQAMVSEGIVEEVKGLLAKGVAPDSKPMRSVGYKETVDAIQSGKLEQLAEEIYASTRKLAKAQMTWFRGERNVEWLEPSYLGRILDSLTPR